MILVSACLVGRPTRYDGRTSTNLVVMDYLRDKRWIAVCPEQLGGLPTPRTPARLAGGNGADVLAGRARVITIGGNNVTEAFIQGAESVLELAHLLGATTCLVKDRSPSCGLTSAAGQEGLLTGPGVMTALFLKAGFEVIEFEAFAVSSQKT